MNNLEQTNGHLLDHVLAFTYLLHEMGVDVGTGQVLELVRALEYVPMTAREDFRDAMRCTLIRRHEDLPLFDMAFEFFWRLPENDMLRLALPQVKVPGRPLRLPRQRRNDQSGAGDDPQKNEQEEEKIGLTRAYTASEVLRQKDFGTFSWEEVQACKDLMRRMQWRIDERKTRRSYPARTGRRLDMRRTLRRNMRYGAEPLELRWREVRTHQRPLVVLCDISGSMDRYSRILLQFIFTMTNGLHDVEAFVFGTRLTRITRMLRQRDIDDAISDVSKQVVDWSGGTRIGETLKEFNYVWGRRVLGRGAVVMIISDGWDRGDPELLRREIGRLQRSCYRLIWLNPLLGSPGYQPLTQGIQAALPYVDDFLPVHNLASLEDLGKQLSALGERRPERRQRPTPSQPQP
jgi:uncharacterized protein with von Willebrand factor type A (vWA) domain